MKSLVSLALALSAFSAFAQGSAAGYGQAGGGGFGGGRVGKPGRATSMGDLPYSPVAPIAPSEDTNFWVQKSLVLSPGDKVEWKLDAKAGQVLMATAESDTFDPALVVEGPNGKVVVQNDDREEGNQSPYIILKFPTDGLYKVRVVSFRNNAGGKFSFQMRQFSVQDVKPGTTQTAYTVSEAPSNGSLAVWCRYTAKKGEIISLRRMFLGNAGCGFHSLVGPTGSASDATQIFTPVEDMVFRAERDGEYYCEWRTGQGAQGDLKTEMSLMSEMEVGMDAVKKVKLSPGQRVLMNIPVKTGMPMRTKIEADRARLVYGFYVPSENGRDDLYAVDEGGAWGTSQQVATFRYKNASALDQIRIFKREGIARVVIANQSDKEAEFSIENTTKLDNWTNGPVVTDKLGIAESKYYILDSSKSDLKKVWTKTSAFEMQLDIFNMQGDLANSMTDLKNHSPSDDLYFPNAGKFLVRISCVGNGGSGEYQLRQDSTLPTAYASAAPGTVKLTGENFGLYAVELKKGVRYEVVLEDQDSACSVDLLDDEGTFLTSPTIRFGAMRAFYFTPVRDGRHRLWIRGRPGDYKFVLRPHADPKIG